MTDPVLWVLLTLASYRLWRLLALDTLPGLVHVRERLAERWPDPGQGAGRWVDAIWCPWCLGFWCCALVFGVAHLLTAGANLWLLVVHVAAASTVVGLMGANLDG